MNEDIAALTKKSQDLQEKLKTLTSTNSSLLFYLNKLGDKLADFKPHSGDNRCVICYTRKIECATVPCGHLTCVDCSERVLNRGRCFTCRGTVSSMLKIFI